MPLCWRQKRPLTNHRSNSAREFHTLCEKTSLLQRAKVLGLLIENGLYWTKLLQSKLLPRLKAIRWKEHYPATENGVGGRARRTHKSSGCCSTPHRQFVSFGWSSGKSSLPALRSSCCDGFPLMGPTGGMSSGNNGISARHMLYWNAKNTRLTSPLRRRLN